MCEQEEPCDRNASENLRVFKKGGSSERSN